MRAAATAATPVVRGRGCAAIAFTITWECENFRPAAFPTKWNGLTTAVLRGLPNWSERGPCDRPASVIRRPRCGLSAAETMGVDLAQRDDRPPLLRACVGVLIGRFISAGLVTHEGVNLVPSRFGSSLTRRGRTQNFQPPAVPDSNHESRCDQWKPAPGREH